MRDVRRARKIEYFKERACFKTSPFAQSLRQAQILILEILNVCLWLKFSPALVLNKIEHFLKVSLFKAKKAVGFSSTAFLY
jgi:hypothetical protein